MSTKFLIFNILMSSLIITYPDPITSFQLVLYILVGITIWSAITRPLKKRTIKEKLSDYLGQFVLSVIATYIVKNKWKLDTEFEFLLAGFGCGLVSYGLLLIYRWSTSLHFLNFIKEKFKNKLK